MKAWFRTTFADGSTEEAEAETAAAAKTAAKNKRILEVDPGRSMATADMRRHDRVKVTRVEEFTRDGAHEDARETAADPAAPATQNTYPN